jgi:hypothetical protein
MNEIYLNFIFSSSMYSGKKFRRNIAEEIIKKKEQCNVNQHSVYHGVLAVWILWTLIRNPKPWMGH